MREKNRVPKECPRKDSSLRLHGIVSPQRDDLTTNRQGPKAKAVITNHNLRSEATRRVLGSRLEVTRRSSCPLHPLTPIRLHSFPLRTSREALKDEEDILRGDVLRCSDYPHPCGSHPLLEWLVNLTIVNLGLHQQNILSILRADWFVILTNTSEDIWE